MKRWFVVCVIFLFAVLSFSYMNNPASAQSKPTEPNVARATFDPNKVLVSVNGEDIKEGTVKKYIPFSAGDKDAAGQTISQTFVDQESSRVLDDLITNTVVLQQIKSHNIVVSDDEVDKYIVTMLATMEPPMTLADLKAQIEEKMGTPFEQWKEREFKNRMLMEKLLEISYPDKLKVTDEDANRYYGANLKLLSKA